MVTGYTVNSSGNIVDSNVTMNVILLRGAAGNNSIIGFRQRDFFQVNSAQQDLKLRFTKTIDGTTVSGAYVIAHVLLQRLR